MKPFQLRDKKTGELRHGGQWLIRFKAPDGTWRRMVAGATEKEAARVLAETEIDIRRGTWIDPRVERAEAKVRDNDCRTFGDIVDRFRRFYASRAEGTRINLETVVNRLDRGMAGAPSTLPLSTPIHALTKTRLRRVYDGIAATPFAVSTKNQTLKITKTILRWAWKHPGIPLDENPAEDLPKFRAMGSRGGDGSLNQISKAEVWSRDEAAAMVAYAEENFPEAVAVSIRTALETGMRKGEICGLLWSGVDFDRRLILVSRNYDRRGTKSGKDRVVPMTAGLTARLRQWRAASPCSKEHDPVFPDDRGRVRTRNDRWSSDMKKCAVAAGCWRPEMKRPGHLTRHYFATQWLLSGGSAEQLARVLGHVDTSLICRVYSHFQDGDFVTTVDRIGLSLDVSPEPAEVVSIGR